MESKNNQSNLLQSFQQNTTASTNSTYQPSIDTTLYSIGGNGNNQDIVGQTFFCNQSTKQACNSVGDSNENEIKNLNVMVLKKHEINEKKDLIVLKKCEEKKNLLSSQHLLFTCIKPSCNLIFYSFMAFKNHHRIHFKVGNDKLICWQCCSSFSSSNCLKMHQSKGNCFTLGIFQCFECYEKYDDLQSLSVHKYTLHNGDLVIKKKGKKCLMCVFCKIDIDINKFKHHLVNCKSNNMNKISSRSELLKIGRHKCLVCGKLYFTARDLSNHKNLHNNILPNKTVNKRKSFQLAYTSNSNNIGITKVLNQTSPNTSHSNNVITSISSNIVNTIDDKAIVEELSLSASSVSQRKIFKISENIFPFADGFYLCIKCPKKFDCEEALSKHWQFCSKLRRSKIEVPQNHYCTKCEQYFTRTDFGHHWKIYHGKRLKYLKYKRFPCYNCNLRFAYKIALLMHDEFVHGKLEKDKNYYSDEENNKTAEYEKNVNKIVQ